jgi:hypothetical protein
MSAESELYAALTGLPALTALVSTRIYPDAIPEDVTLPAVVTAREGTEHVTGISGAAFGEFAQMTVSAWAPTRTLAESIGNQIAEAMRLAGNPATDRAGSYDEEMGLFAVTLKTTWFIAA